ncbi:hypothetical protein D5125_08215 [Magnetovirga frankeli]|uniref:hypothetical protein n=1 Tax=Magnetovirga frankeli TaxID=947516 RepID=UPI001294084F|nr:hypothetical protein D5125_08215 [gamma proteobacterium SS-5]
MKPATTPQSTWRQRLFSSSGAAMLAAALLVMLLIIAVAPLMQTAGLQSELDAFYQGEIELQPQAWPWQPEPDSTNAELPRPSAAQANATQANPIEQLERQAFRYGIGRGLIKLRLSEGPWRAILAQYPEQPPLCGQDIPHCGDRRTLALAGGYWALAAFGRCQSGLEPTFSAELAGRLQAPSQPRPSVLEQRLSSLATQADCAQVRGLLDWAHLP